MKPWPLHEPDPSIEVMEAMQVAGLAILEADEHLPEMEDLILFDLQTSVATRFVAMPVRHVHNQDCGRA